MLDTGTASPVPAPLPISDDAILAEDGCDQFWDAAIPAVGEDSLVAATDELDVGSSVVNHVVAIARAACLHSDHVQIVAACDDLGIA
jgi:hypothetical protein